MEWTLQIDALVERNYSPFLMGIIITNETSAVYFIINAC